MAGSGAALSRASALLHPAALALAGCLAALLLFDVLAYFLMPASLTTFAPDYRLPPPSLHNTRGYFRIDPVLGFDIAPNQPGHHRQHIPGHGLVSISSNDLGCRDPRDLAEVRALDDYVYFAGDSFTWGFSRESHAFPRIYERASGNPSLNCGAPSTGQFHQLEKFRRTVRAVGRLPFRVVIGHFPNDTRDDLHPEPTKGLYWAPAVLQREAAGLLLAGRQKEGRRPSLRYRPAVVPQGGKPAEERPESSHGLQLLRRMHFFLAQHSLSYLMARKAVQPKHPSLSVAARNTIRLGDYPRNPYTRPNRAALKAWAQHAEGQGYELAVVLIPQKELLGSHLSREWREGVKGLLDSLGVRHLDFAGHVEDRGISPDSLYWEHEAHMNEHGNQVLGEWLARELP